MGKVISFINNKGGVAKTVSSFNVGILYSMMKKKVLFVDLDAQANLTRLLSSHDERYDYPEFQWEKTIEDAFIAGPKIMSLPVYPSRYEGVDFVPSDLSLSNFDTDTSNKDLKLYLLKDLLRPLKDKYDFIILDCPPNLGSIVSNAMIASDAFVLVTTPDQPSLDGCRMVINMQNKFLDDERLNPYLQFVGCLVTKVKNDKLNKNYIKVIEGNFREYVIKPYIKENTKLNQSASLHVDIFSHDPNGRGAADYMAVGKEILLRLV